MRVTVTARHIDHTPSIDAYAREKAGKLEHLFDGITSVTITLDVGRKGRDGQMAEFIAHVTGGGTCVSHAKAKSLYAAIDAAEARLQGQIRRAKARLRLR
jgi:ribosomal subunit interface protein